jgi:DNA-directed RNA polymerase subunit omega
MARITIEDCLNHTPNRFALVCLARQRAYDLIQGAPPAVVCNNKEAVTALREVAAGKIGTPPQPDPHG